MDEANRNDCSICRERRSASKINGAKRLDFCRTAFGLLLLLLMMMALVLLGYTRMRTNDERTVTRKTLSNIIGDLGIDRQDVNALDKVGEMRDNIDAVHSSGTAAEATEQRRHRRKREASSENEDTSRRYDSDADGSLPIHSESQPTEDTVLADLKQRINLATSVDEIRDIVQSSFPKDVLLSTQSPTTKASDDLKSRPCQCHRSKSSVGAKKSLQKKSNRQTKTGLQKLLKIVQTNATCSRKLVSVVGEFGMNRTEEEDDEEEEKKKRKEIPLRICESTTQFTTSPSQEWMKNLTEKAAENHTRWMHDIQQNSLCRPMEMIIDLEPARGLNQGPVMALIRVKKCRLLYIAANSNENVTCFDVKKRTKLVPIQYNNGVIKTYIVTDHLECSTNRSAVVRKVETTTNKATTIGSTEKKNNKRKNNKRKNKSSCPSPFVVSGTRCICNKTTVDAPGYLHYLTCKNIKKGIWKLEEAEIKCVRERRCLQPSCDKGKFKRRMGVCCPIVGRCPKRNSSADPRRHSRKRNT